MHMYLAIKWIVYYIKCMYVMFSIADNNCMATNLLKLKLRTYIFGHHYTIN